MPEQEMLEEWGTTEEAILANMLDTAAWHLLDVSSDLADREPSPADHARAKYGAATWLAARDRRIQAGALRAAAADNQHGWALRSWLNERADLIESAEEEVNA